MEQEDEGRKEAYGVVRMKIPNIKLTKREVVIAGGSSVVAASLSGVAVYILTKKKMELKFYKLMDEEAAATKEYYKQLYKQDEYSDPEALLESLHNETIITEERYIPVEDQEIVVDESEPDSSEDEPEVVNILVKPDDKFNLEEEMANRTEDAPYILHRDEFMQGALGYEQTTLTYFEGDDVLVDERDQVVDDTEGTVGNDNLLKFGHGSKDNNVVYIRNDRLELDIEVLRSRGKYTQEVLGFIEHSDKSIRKFRRDDG